MGEWSKASRTHADHMRGGDFFCSEQSITVEEPTTVRIEFVKPDGDVEVKKQLDLEAGEVGEGWVQQTHWMWEARLPEHLKLRPATVPNGGGLNPRRAQSQTRKGRGARLLERA